jgi:O-antigen/teichoic acid export membrane protein
MNLIEITKNIFSRPKEFFLENLGVRQTIFKNTFWLGVAEAVSRFLKLILIIYVARILGATDYGKFNFALAFVSLFAIFSDIGLSQITTRELSRDKGREKEISSLFSLKILLSLGTLILILISSFFITPDPVIRKIIWILGIFTVISSFSTIIFAFFQARQRMEYQALANIFQAIIITAVGFFVILNFPSVENLSYAYLLAGLSALIFILIFFHFKVSPLKISWKKSIWQRFLSMSWPLALAGIFGSIYSQTDSVMMGYWGQITQTGWYNAAYKIIGVTFIPTSLIATSFYPALSKFFQDPKAKLQMVWNYFMDSMIILAIPVVVGGIALAPRIIDFIYDPTYFPTGKETILAFQILLIMAGFAFLSNPFGQILVVANQQKKLFFVTLAGAFINVILNLILIPRYSLYGAALTTCATCFLIFFLLFKFTLRLIPIQPFNLKSLASFFGAILASIPMYFLIIQPKIYNLNIFLSISIGAAIYVITFLIIKIVRKKFFYET